jgi:hypothetical protein
VSAAELVALAEKAGLLLEPREGGVLHVAPRERLTPALREALAAMKSEVLAVLRGRSLGVDWTRIRLHDLDRVLELAVPWADVPLILAPGCRIARALRESDPRPGRVWCTCEILDLLLTGIGPEDARRIAEAKLMLNGNVGGARRLNP